MILAALRLADAHDIVEIGAEYGGMSERLGDHVERRGGRLVCVDPAPKPTFLAWVAGAPHVRHIAQPSLDAIDALGGIDAWLIDGDHNWYTVFHELSAIEACCRRDGKPMLAVIHDVGWPCARRDMYYAPDRIPEAFRHPFSYDGGVVLDHPTVVTGRGFRGMGAFAIATREGGPRNGVLTAIDDFLAAAMAQGREYACAEIPGVFGLGVLFALDAPWSASLADLLMPFHQNALLATLERNRLRNYLRVIDIQDEAAARSQTRAF